jgi:glycosyltransferase involved in cell wall biosynthesis
MWNDWASPVSQTLSLALIERRLIGAASVVHFTSLSEQSEAEALGLKFKGVVIPLGIDISKAECRTTHTSKGDGTFKLLYLSRIDPKKNIEGSTISLAEALPCSPERRW